MNEMRIYVASLSDYNNGRLEGKWLDLSDYSDASELMEAIQEMLDELTEKYKSVDGEVREEFAVHDYEGIPSTLASEYMGEQDFQQLYDIAEVADDRGIPVEVLIERAGDTGSDDYQALADSLIMSVNGNDESDIVYEYENQIGELGFDWWSNHVGITITDQRLLYGEDVDNFKEEILAENPDMDESEAEGQAEEMADAEEEARNSDLIGYLQERGYEDEFPNWVYKDYQDAWENDLSYEFDVIHHDGRMYVFTNNYGLGGTILSGVIGAYIGYKIGRAKPQKKGFETEKKIGRKIKGAFSKKKMAKGGDVYDNSPILAVRNYDADYFVNESGDLDDNGTIKRYAIEIQSVPSGDVIEYTSAYSEKEASEMIKKINATQKVYAEGGGVSYNKNWEVVGITSNGKMFKETITLGRMSDKEDVKNALNRRTDLNIREITSIKEVFAKGGGVSKLKKGDKVYAYLIYNDGYGYDLVESPSLGNPEDGEIIEINNENGRIKYKIRFDNGTIKNVSEGIFDDYIYKYAKGGGVDSNRYVIMQDTRGFVEQGFWGVIDTEKNELIDIFEFKKEAQGYLKEIKEKGISKADASKFNGQIDNYGKGGGIGFKGLSSKVAKRYEGKSVAPKYQSQYGTTYSKSEAKEVGDKVAGKVYWQQQGRKMAQGGNIFKGSRGKNQKVKDWYIKNYPTDDLGEEINDQMSFEGIWRLMNQRNDFYDLIGVADSVVRERVFSRIAEIYGIDYDLVYDTWLGKFAQGGGVGDKRNSRVLEILDEVTDYEDIDKKDIPKIFIAESFEKGLDDDEIQTKINKHLIGLGYTYDYDNYKWVKQYANGGGVEYVSWEITFFDRYDTKSFVLDVQGDFDNEQDAIDEVVREYDIYVDKNNYGQMYYNGNPVEVSDAKRVIEHRRFKKGGGVDLFSMSKTINDEGQISEMVIAENVSVDEFNNLFSDKGYRKVYDKSLVGFYFAKPNGDTIQLIPSFHKKGILKYAQGGGISGLDDLLRG